MKKILRRNYIFVMLLLLSACDKTTHLNGVRPIEVDFTDTVSTSVLERLNPKSKPVYVAISAMISPKETFVQYQKLLDYVAEKLGRKVILKQRKTYREINELLKEGELDFSLICTGAYIEGKKEFPMSLLAVPLVNNEPYYQAYIITNKKNNYERLADLRNTKFAFTDPMSNTGCNYIKRYLAEGGIKAEDFFGETIFTFAHDYSIDAVSKGIADAASIDGLIYEYMAKFYPKKIGQIKIIHKSEKFGIPPFVYSANADPVLIQEIQNILLNMHNTGNGRKILDNILIDKFILGNEKIYEGYN
ncbi:MAG: PhnD/SsuA/transferrin family substrate-binding protein [Bacteroidota bacterium]|nr:PhnD/SsuA/transferrin family substrate-binding protein [Bacteroidota bacterium]